MCMPDSKRRKAKIFMNNRSQAVRLPKEFQFRATQVFIRREGSDVVLSPRPSDWLSSLRRSRRLSGFHGERDWSSRAGAQAINAAESVLQNENPTPRKIREKRGLPNLNQ